MPRWPSSLRARLTLWYTALLAVPLAVFAFACYFVFASALATRTDRFIGDALTVFARELGAERRVASTAREAMATTVHEVWFRDLHVAILDSAGAVVAASAPPENDGGPTPRPSSQDAGRLVEALRALDRAAPLAITVTGGRDAYRVLSRPVEAGGERFALTGAYSLRDVDEMLDRVRGMFLIAIPLLLLVAGGGGYALARRSLAPVAEMAAQAAHISATTLHERLPVGGGDELVGLAHVVNELLDRLEHAFAQQRRFVADASHELRTPAAILRTEADVTLSREHRDEAEYRASVTVMQGAAQRLTRIVDDLFLLARADAGHLVARPEALYLEELVHDATRAVRSVAEQAGVKVALSGVVEAPFTGDPDLLGRLLLNLLDNAIKYSPAGGTVTVDLARRGAAYEISVADGGPGIPAELHERVFERFYRVDTARSRSETSSTSGAGLGLSIARRIAEMHGGRLVLAASRPGHTEFRVTLPAPQSAAGNARVSD